MRMLHGQRKPCAPSMFLGELALTPAPRPKSAAFQKPSSSGNMPQTGAKGLAGKTVYHSKFGDGKIIGTSGSGAAMKADVFFAKAGFKKVMVSFLQVKD